MFRGNYQGRDLAFVLSHEHKCYFRIYGHTLYYINCHSATQFNLSDSLRLAAELLYNNVPFQFRLSPCIADGNPLRSLPR